MYLSTISYRISKQRITAKSQPSFLPHNIIWIVAKTFDFAFSYVVITSNKEQHTQKKKRKEKETLAFNSNV